MLPGMLLTTMMFSVGQAPVEPLLLPSVAVPQVEPLTGPAMPGNESNPTEIEEPEIAPPPRRVFLNPQESLVHPTPIPYAAMAAPESVKESLNDPHLGPPNRAWGSASYLMYQLKDGPLDVPLLVRSQGVSRQTVLGNQSLDFGTANGVAFDAGVWLDNCHTLGIGVGGMLIEERSQFSAFNGGAPSSVALQRPFLNANTIQMDFVNVALPGVTSGSLFTKATNRLSAAEVYGIRNLYYGPEGSINFLFGGRYFDLDESIGITQVSTALPGEQIFFTGRPIPGDGQTSVTIRDRFRTRNQFYGGYIGLRGEVRYGIAYANLSTKLGMGGNQQVLQIDGSSTLSNNPNAAAGGFLALPRANTGLQGTSRFAVLSEVGANVGLQVASCLRLGIGYDFLYLSDVIRPGQQIDTVINPRLVPTNQLFNTISGPSTPRITGQHSDFFAHGVRFTVELQY